MKKIFFEPKRGPQPMDRRRTQHLQDKLNRHGRHAEARAFAANVRKFSEEPADEVAPGVRARFDGSGVAAIYADVSPGSDMYGWAVKVARGRPCDGMGPDSGARRLHGAQIESWEDADGVHLICQRGSVAYATLSGLIEVNGTQLNRSVAAQTQRQDALSEPEDEPENRPILGSKLNRSGLEHDWPSRDEGGLTIREMED